MSYKNNIKTSFLAIPENESLARVVCAAFLSQLDPTVEELTDVKTAVSEAVTNSVVHGYSGKKDGIVFMDCYIDGEVFTVDIEIAVFCKPSGDLNGNCAQLHICRCVRIFAAEYFKISVKKDIPWLQARS